jgi:hypothetical protein
MELARAWTRQAFQASGAAVLMPGMLIIALIVLAVGGGFGGLGVLGQALSGPGFPAGSNVAGVPGASGAPSPLPPVVPAGPGPGTTPVGVAGAGAGAPGAAGGGIPATGPRPVDSGGGQKTPGSKVVGGQPVGAPPPGRGTTSPPPPGPTPARPSLVDQIVGVGTSVTGRLPRPVGPLGTQLLQSLAHTVDSILPPIAHSPSRPAPSPPQLVSSLRTGLPLP